MTTSSPDQMKNPSMETFSEPQTLISKAKSFIASQRKSIKPWKEFIHSPELPKTTSKFRANYIVVSLILAAYTLVTSPFLLLSIAVLYACWTFASLRKEAGPVIVFGHEYTSQDLLRGTFVLAIVLLYMASATSALFWLIGASLAFILIHASFITIPSPEQLEESV
eukprot:gene723-4016_t